MNWKTALYVIASLLAVALLWYDTQVPVIPVAPVGMAVPATPAPAVAHETKTATPVKFAAIKTYPKATKRKLHLPQPVQANDAVQVIEASRVAADDHPQTVTTVIDTQTGDTQTFTVREPLPLVAKETTGEIGLYYGLKSGTKALRLEARQGLITIKALHIGVIGALDQPLGSAQPSSLFVGAGAWMRW